MMLRGSGIDHDLRRDMPYDAYASLKFATVVGSVGDSLDRYFLRVEEMRQSLHIIEQALNRMPAGPVKTDDQKVVPPSRGELKQSMEALIHHFKYYSSGIALSGAETYCQVEAPKGEFGIFLASTAANTPDRVKIKAPGLLHLQSLNALAQGHLIADVVTTIGTQDIVFGEVDR